MFYIILVSSWTLISTLGPVLYHTCVLLDLDGWSISYSVLLALMAVLYHTRVP